MKSRIVAALALTAALCACGGGGGEKEVDEGEGDMPVALPGEAAPGVPAEPSGPTFSEQRVARQIAETARAAEQQFPAEIGGATVTGMQANGMELITAVTVPMNLTQDMAAQMAPPLSERICADLRLADLVRSGGMLTWLITDEDGETFTVQSGTC